MGERAEGIDWYSELYAAVTSQLEHESDVLGGEGNVEGVESVERVRLAVADVNRQYHSIEGARRIAFLGDDGRVSS